MTYSPSLKLVTCQQAQNLHQSLATLTFCTVLTNSRAGFSRTAPLACGRGEVEGWTVLIGKAQEC